MTVFGYARISVDLDEDSRENTSIENQVRIIEDYAAERFPAAALTIFKDRDRSGYTFEQREDYQRMRPRLLSGEVSTLIVKDFSRFSRRNSLGLLELETLRDAGVRIISIGDGIDYPTKDDWMLIQFKFLMNEMSVTDTSKKIRQLIANKQKNGKWVCAVPYGYRLINTKEMTYEIDPPAAEVVREIFALYNNGWGYKAIANHLTDKGVPTPRAGEIAWREANGQRTKLKAKEAWSIVSVVGILRNDFYIGVLRQHKYTRAKINGADKPLDEEAQIVLENAHTPILDTPTFLYAQDQLRLRSRSNYRGVKKYPCDYSGYLFCGDCGEPMFSRSRPDLRPSYICGTYMKRGTKGCSSHHIRVDKLDEVLKRYIKRVRDNSASMLAQLEEAVKQQPEREADIGRTIESLDRQLETAREQLKALYKRKLLDTMGKDADQTAIIDETYQELERELLQRVQGLETQVRDSIDSRNRLIQVNRRAKTAMDVFDAILRKEKLDKRDVGLIVERIDVFDDRLDIRLKPDVHELLALETETDSEPLTVTQESSRRAEKTYAVNVVNEGETAEIAMRSAITGHVVLSTIRTNDAVGTIERLEDTGVEAYLIASALRGVISQRLVRRICPDCRKPYVPAGDELDDLDMDMEPGLQFYRGEGCPNCFDTGFKGRIAVFEMLLITRELRAVTNRGGTRDELEQILHRSDSGFVPLRRNAIRLVREGVTTVGEVRRVISQDD